MAKKAISLKNLPEVAARLRASRQRIGMTQKQLAERLGLKQPYINRYESGTVEPPLAVMIKLAEIYGVSVDWLLTGRDPCETADNRPPPRRFPHITKRERDYLDKTLVILRAEGEAKGLVKLLTGQIDGLYEEVRKLSSKAGSQRAKTKRAS